MPRNGSVSSFGRAFADQDLVANLSLRVKPLTPWTSGCPPGTQVFVQVSAQMAAALNEQALIDRLVGHLHLRPVREGSGEVVADLFRTPILHQPLFNRSR